MSSEELLEALREVRELIDGYIDVRDGSDGRPMANDAMHAAQIIDAVLTKAERS